MRLILSLLILALPAYAEDSTTYTVRLQLELTSAPLAGATQLGDDGWVSTGTFTPKDGDEQIPCALFFDADGTFSDASCDI